MNSRGAEWRKWDLHIHTPASFHWNGDRFAQMNAEQKQTTLQSMVSKMDATDIVAFGVMDYWTFDGYWALRDYLGKMGLNPKWALFPGMELRIEAPVDFRLNIHVLLSPSLTPQQLLNFKSTLKIGKEPLSDEALVNFAKQLDNGKIKQAGFKPEAMTADSYLELGSQTAKVTRESFGQARSLLPEGTCLVIMPYDTSDGLEKLAWKKHPSDDLFFLREADFFETRNAKQVDSFLGQQTSFNAGFIEDLQKAMGAKAKPVVSGSDAHKIADYGLSPSGRATWLKAAPTFDGLRHVIREPHSRCFIGVRPPKLDYVNNNKTKFIDRVRITPKPGAATATHWFNVDLPLNSDLVAIIGNKGQGKSALAESIGIAGNSRQVPSFSFLSPTHFKHPKGNLASKFVASLQWMSGNGSVSSLDAAADATQPELVKVIPQRFLEDICNQVGLPDEGDFDKELRKVIFSHVEEAERLGKSSMESHLELRTAEALRKQQSLRDEIKATNLSVVEVEAKLEPTNEATLRSQLIQKEAELEAHRTACPPAIDRPSADATPEGSTVAASLEKASETVAHLEGEAEDARIRLSGVASLLAAAERLGERLSLLADHVAKATTELEADAQQLGLKVSDVIAVTFSRAGLEAKQKELVASQEEIRKALNASIPDSTAAKLDSARESARLLRDQLDAPNKEYQAHLIELAEWKARETEIIGNRTQPNTITFIQSEIAELTTLPELRRQLVDKRNTQCASVHAILVGLMSTYQKLYAPVQAFITAKDIVRSNFDLRFSVSITDTGFEDGFLGRINRGIAGSFYGIEDGAKRLREMLSRADLNNPDSVMAFLSELEVALVSDLRHSPTKQARKLDIAKGKKGLLDLYNYIYCLEWMTPRYGLRLGDKELHQLSPGERGTMLLVFYLMVDKGDIPLVIDQPEENLDNQTVFSLLVPCIRDAKSRRQIVIVTHNPNLAVVCDAEQIIHAKLNKKNDYEITYVAGPFEDPKINRAVIDVLEGTRVAFDDREAKYRPGT